MRKGETLEQEQARIRLAAEREYRIEQMNKQLDKMLDRTKRMVKCIRKMAT